ncbi:hypothetical protein QUB47_33195, partial [Microcoleus sp. AT9_B5]
MKISLVDSKSTTQQDSKQDYVAIAKSLAQEFADTAIERDRLGGTPKYEPTFRRCGSDFFISCENLEAKQFWA